jgi:MFS superfamily sulfate permease-like transporter
VGVLVFDTLPGLFIGIVVSIVLLLYRASLPHVARLALAPGTTDQYTDVARHPGNTVVAGVPVLRPESPLFFANADRVRAIVKAAAAEPGTRAIVLDLETVPAVDVTAIRMLEALRADLERDGVTLVLARDIGQVHDLMRRELGGESRLEVHPTVSAAIAAVTEPTS